MRADVSSVIICDDVRKEINGKDFLIGVYSGTVNVPAYPSLLSAAFWIEIEPHGIGTIPCRFRIDTPSGNPPIEIGADLDVTELGTAVFVVGGVPLSLEHDGEIVVSAKIGTDEMKAVKRKKVQRGSFPGTPVQ
jgi:hypothetical protein